MTTMYMNNISGNSRSNRSSRDNEDVTTKIIGDFGKWQLRISILMAVLKLPIAWYQLNIIFMAPPQDFWCVKPKSFYRYSEQEWRKVCSPVSLCIIY